VTSARALKHLRQLQAVSTAHIHADFRFRHHPNEANTARPVAKSERAAGRGIGARSNTPSALKILRVRETSPGFGPKHDCDDVPFANVVHKAKMSPTLIVKSEEDKSPPVDPPNSGSVAHVSGERQLERLTLKTLLSIVTDVETVQLVKKVPGKPQV
jgi:hypothetical protein